MAEPHLATVASLTEVTCHRLRKLHACGSCVRHLSVQAARTPGRASCEGIRPASMRRKSASPCYVTAERLASAAVTPSSTHYMHSGLSLSGCDACVLCCAERSIPDGGDDHGGQQHRTRVLGQRHGPCLLRADLPAQSCNASCYECGSQTSPLSLLNTAACCMCRPRWFYGPLVTLRRIETGRTVATRLPWSARMTVRSACRCACARILTATQPTTARGAHCCACANSYGQTMVLAWFAARNDKPMVSIVLSTTDHGVSMWHCTRSCVPQHRASAMRSTLAVPDSQWYLLRLANMSTLLREWIALHLTQTLACMDSILGQPVRPRARFELVIRFLRWHKLTKAPRDAFFLC